jgi:predicted small lipoprotein YifL
MEVFPMKKVLSGILSIVLILSLCACGVKTTDNPDISPAESSNQSELLDEEPSEEPDSSNQWELPDEEPSEEIDDINSTKGASGDTDNFKTFWEAKMAFESYVAENSPEDEDEPLKLSLVLQPENGIYHFMTPLIYWGETLDDMEIVIKDAILNLFTGEKKNFKSADLKKTSDNSYTMTGETKKGEQAIINVDYYPDIDAVRLIAQSDGEQPLLFEYVRNGDGYAAQFYYNAVVRSTYNAQEKAMCVYRVIFSGNNGSCARFDDTEEPASLLDEVPDEKTFIDGATHWLTVKGDKFTGELDGTAF